MKTKTIAILIAFFFNCGLFAQNRHDTVPMPTRTDTMRRTDSTMRSSDTTKMSAFVIDFQNPFRITYNRFFTTKENEFSVSAI